MPKDKPAREMYANQTKLIYLSKTFSVVGGAFDGIKLLSSCGQRKLCFVTPALCIAPLDIGLN